MHYVTSVTIQVCLTCWTSPGIPINYTMVFTM
ncbi:hypothetical protein [Klebsiella phage vB_KvaP_F4M1D]|nr:hypothetical protein [Klebsiella phage vB_KvaP_F4M1D]